MRDMPDEANRQDGKPAPDLTPTDQGVAPPPADERERKHRQRLADEGCAICDEDDPDALHMVNVPTRDPRAEPFEVRCDDHLEVDP